MTELRDKWGSAPDEQEYLPTRNLPLNVHLGGGLLFGCINEIHGDEGMFKTTFLTETAVDALAADCWVVIHDREGRINAHRIRTLGGDPKHPRLIYRGNRPQILTIETVFSTMTQIMADIRSADAEAIAKKLDAKKPAKALVEEYGQLFGMDKPDGKKLAVAVRKYWNKLRKEDMSKVVWLIDSATAMPTRSELIGSKKNKDVPKGKHAGDDLEIKIRQDHTYSQEQGAGARVWSDHFRACVCLDERVCAIMTAQMRTKGIGTSFVFKDAAIPKAHRFYSRTMIHAHPVEQGKVYANPAGGYFYGYQSGLQEKDKEVQVGRILALAVKKTMSNALLSIPAFMIGTTGTDIVNTVWEYLTRKNLISHTSGGYYTIATKHAKAEEIGSFRRDKFVTSLYEEHVQVWKELIEANAGVTAQ